MFELTFELVMEVIMQELSSYIAQLIESWQGKFMLSTLLTAVAWLIEQFGTAFGADSFLTILLFVVIWIELLLGLVLAIKSGRFDCQTMAQGVLKLPLYCLYLFLIASIAVSIEHSVNISLPLLNLFISYLIASEVFIIIRQLHLLGFKVPPLLLFIVRNAKGRFEHLVHKGLSVPKHDRPKPSQQDHGSDRGEI